ncbi:MAG: hypothetical protein WB626_00695 [Bacteroidota bacterium]
MLLVLVVCIVGVMTSVGVIAFQDFMAPDNRLVLREELHRMGAAAQRYYRTPAAQGGGEGTFLALNLLPEGIRRLTDRPSTKQGDFFIRHSGLTRSTEIMAIGVERGFDSRYPVRISLTVWPDSMALRMHN